MIKNKKDLKFYMLADKFSLGINKSYPFLNDEIWKFQILLRKVEYYKNTASSFNSKLLLKFYQYRKHKLGLKLGFDIPPNVFGPGLRINHFGNIVVNGKAKVGKWCDIHQGVNIGSNNSVDGDSLVPTLGDNVWIGPGAKIFGDIKIGDEVQIAANSVVNKSYQSNVTIAGIPAKTIRFTGTDGVSVAASKSRMEQFIKLYPEFKGYFEQP